MELLAHMKKTRQKKTAAPEFGAAAAAKKAVRCV
jgi:hypothetical protein